MSVRALLQRQPRFSVAYVDATYPFRSPEDREFFLHGLREAGMAGLAGTGS